MKIHRDRRESIPSSQNETGTDAIEQGPIRSTARPKPSAVERTAAHIAAAIAWSTKGCLTLRASEWPRHLRLRYIGIEDFDS
jgi:hypothetical protein